MNPSFRTKIRGGRPTIFVTGPAETCNADIAEKARALGHEIAHTGAVLLTGTARGFVAYVAEGAAAEGGMVFGLSPASNVDEHVSLYGLPLVHHDTIIYTGFGFSGRDMMLARSADAVIIGSGDVTHAYDVMLFLREEKPAGILECPWLLDDTLKTLIVMSGRPESDIVFDADPSALVPALLSRIPGSRRA